MRSLISLIIVASAAMQTVAAADTALPGSAPVSIDTCSVAQPGTLGNPKFGYRPAYVEGVTIVYTNARAVAATEVRFAIVYAGITRTAVDRSTLAGGKKRTREFDIGSPIYTSDSAACRIAGVTFADGTSYTPPAP